MAEEVGFEPTVRVHVRRFSRPVHSTTLPLLRSRLVIGRLLILKVAKTVGKDGFRHRVAEWRRTAFHEPRFNIHSFEITGAVFKAQSKVSRNGRCGQGAGR